MALGTLNYWAVLAAAVASFIFGGVWYSVLAKQWLEAGGRSPDTAPTEKAGLGLYLIAFAAQLVMAWMLAGVLLHLSTGGLPITVRNALISAAFLWLGFVITTMAVNYAFHGAKYALTLIDGGHWLGVLLIQGLIIGGMGAR